MGNLILILAVICLLSLYYWLGRQTRKPLPIADAHPDPENSDNFKNLDPNMEKTIELIPQWIDIIAANLSAEELSYLVNEKKYSFNEVYETKRLDTYMSFTAQYQHLLELLTPDTFTRLVKKIEEEISLEKQLINLNRFKSEDCKDEIIRMEVLESLKSNLLAQI